jgi:RNA binding exosome subunit
MGNKIRIYESEIKRATRRKLMEKYIDSVDEAEEMTVYNQDEFDSSFDKLDKGTYGVKDKEGKIRSVTVNDDDDLDQTSKGEPKLLRKSTGISKGKDISKSKIRK